jgi:hypothetical protein
MGSLCASHDTILTTRFKRTAQCRSFINVLEWPGPKAIEAPAAGHDWRDNACATAQKIAIAVLELYPLAGGNVFGVEGAELDLDA